jgi:hypothetical protein
MILIRSYSWATLLQHSLNEGIVGVAVHLAADGLYSLGVVQGDFGGLA